MESCPAHPQMANNIERLLQIAVKNETNINAMHETITKVDERVNGNMDKMDTHMKESAEYRRKVDRDEQRVDQLMELKDDIKKFFWTNVFIIIGAIVSATAAWVTLSTKVDKIAHYSYGYQDHLQGVNPHDGQQAK